MRTLIAVFLLFAGSTLVAQQSNSVYLGCFADQNSPNRDLNGHTFAAGPMNAPICISECKRRGFAYAGTQFGRHCFCGDSYGRFGSSENCGSECLGTRGESCGGAFANSVYRTGLSPLAGERGPGPASSGCLAAGEACPPGNDPSPGQIWEVTEAGGSRAVWSRVGTGQQFEGRIAEAGGREIVARLAMVVDRSSVVITRWIPGRRGLCVYTGQFDSGRTAATGSYACSEATRRWSPSQPWSASIR